MVVPPTQLHNVAVYASARSPSKDCDDSIGGIDIVDDDIDDEIDVDVDVDVGFDGHVNIGIT